AGISNAAAQGARVVVFPEGALRGDGNNRPEIMKEAERAIRGAARTGNIYVLFGGVTYSPKLKKDVNWMSVVHPTGNEMFRYDKLYDQHDAKMPGLFYIDGIPCGTMICAD